MRKILLYHGLREGKLHKVRVEEGMFYEPGELSRRIFDAHPTEDELGKLAHETGREEINVHREVK